MRRDRLRPGGIPSLPEYFPGANERVTGIEIAAEVDSTSLMEERTDPSFLETGRMEIVLPPSEGDAGASHTADEHDRSSEPLEQDSSPTADEHDGSATASEPDGESTGPA
ncbi:hypothetical protein ACTXM8_17350 [Brachybacterium alimentarium]|uniref:hypothetical protein n=1 Tax=Brachybacterium alimentarium TaxID=47845 RepID=UPI003FD533B3